MLFIPLFDRCDYKEGCEDLDSLNDFQLDNRWTTAIKWGSSRVVDKLLQLFFKKAPRFLSNPISTISNNNFKLVKQLLSAVDKGGRPLFRVKSYMLETASSLGQTELVKYLTSFEDEKPLFPAIFKIEGMEMALSLVRSPKYMKIINYLLAMNPYLAQKGLPLFAFNNLILYLVGSLPDTRLLQSLYEGKVRGDAAYEDIDFAWIDSELIKVASCHGNLSLIRICLEKKKSGDPLFCNVKFNFTGGNVSTLNIINIAAQEGNVELLEFIHDRIVDEDPDFRNLFFDTEVAVTAAAYGKLNIIKYFHSRIQEKDSLFINVQFTSEVLSAAVARGSLSVVKYFYNAMRSGQPAFANAAFSPDMVYKACHGNRASVFKFISARF